jgi:hypothetical protein
MAVKLPSFLLLCPLFDFDEGTSRKVFGRSAEGKLGRRPAFLSARLCTSQVMCCFCSAVRKSQNWSICISSGFFRLSRAAASPYFAVSCSWTRSSSACFGSIFRKFAMSRRSRFDGSWIPPTAFRTVSYTTPTSSASWRMLTPRSFILAWSSIPSCDAGWFAPTKRAYTTKFVVWQLVNPNWYNFQAGSVVLEEK